MDRRPSPQWGQHDAMRESCHATCLDGLWSRALRPASASPLRLPCLCSAASPRPMSSLLLRCLGSSASSRRDALAAGGSGAGASLREAGAAASLAPLLFLGGDFSKSSSLEELSSLLLSESLPLSEEESLPLSESSDDESLSEEESEPPAQHGKHLREPFACLSTCMRLVGEAQVRKRYVRELPEGLPPQIKQRSGVLEFSDVGRPLATLTL